MQSILLIGGSSSVGKTHLARILSESLGMDTVCVDDLKKQINEPELRLFGGDERIWNLPALELRSRLFRQDLAVEEHLYVIIHSWRITGKSRILEGEGIVPKLASRFIHTNPVRAIFVIETDAHRLYQTLYKRRIAFQKLTEPRRQRVAEMNSLYGQWLLSEAERHGLPWVASQPWSSLPGRVLDVLSDTQPPI